MNLWCLQASRIEFNPGRSREETIRVNGTCNIDCRRIGRGHLFRFYAGDSRRNDAGTANWKKGMISRSELERAPMEPLDEYWRDYLLEFIDFLESCGGIVPLPPYP